MSFSKRRQGRVLKGIPQEAALEDRAAPGIVQERQDCRRSMSLCVLAPLCVVGMVLLWEGLYAHRSGAAQDRPSWRDGNREAGLAVRSWQPLCSML